MTKRNNYYEFTFIKEEMMTGTRTTWKISFSMKSSVGGSPADSDQNRAEEFSVLVQQRLPWMSDQSNNSLACIEGEKEELWQGVYNTRRTFLSCNCDNETCFRRIGLTTLGSSARSWWLSIGFLGSARCYPKRLKVEPSWLTYKFWCPAS